MQKNSVKQVATKQSQDNQGDDKDPACPLCGATAVRRGQVLSCPEHGTEPWEAK